MTNRSKLDNFLDDFSLGFNASVLFQEFSSKVDVGAITLHPYGFFVIKLNKKNFVIRLHIWPIGKKIIQKPFWPVHCHSFKMQSLVLIGKLENALWTLKEVENSDNVLYEVSYDGTYSCLKKTSKSVEVLCSHKSTIYSGQSYSLLSGSYHSVKVNDLELVITLCITSNFRSSQYVVGNAVGSEIFTYERNQVTVKQHSFVKELLEEHLSILCL